MSPDKITTVFSYSTNFLMGAITLSLNEWIAVLNVVLGFMTFAVNWYYKRRATKLQETKDHV